MYTQNSYNKYLSESFIQAYKIYPFGPQSNHKYINCYIIRNSWQRIVKIH